MLRRIMRRAMRHAHLLGAQEPLMHRLVPTLVAEMGTAYGELRRAEPVIVETLRQEEERFQRTLGRGMGLLEEATSTLSPGAVLNGDVAFKLYDTYGFPLDLTQDAVRAKGLTVDIEAFDQAMDRQRQMARENWTGSGQKAASGVWLELREQHGATDFVGYDRTEALGSVLAIVHDGQSVTSAQPGDDVSVLLDVTPFYAESGGQAGDRGHLSGPQGVIGEVLDTSREALDLHIHAVRLGAALKVGDKVTAAIDVGRRQTTRANHSAAHLAHEALRRVLGLHVSQKGQLVDGDRMRFDFSHGGPVTPAELERIESEVNQVIRQNVEATTRMMAPEAAIAAGAMALFGEKYGDEVRVLGLGSALEGEGAYSVELCGGTHVTRTGDIALFKIMSESGIAAGVRRIEAVTGETARQYLLGQSGIARDLADRFKVPIADLPARIDALDAQRKKLEKELAEAKRALATGGGGGAQEAPEDLNGVKLIARHLDGVGGKDLRPIAEDFRKAVGSGVVALIGTLDGKAAVTVAITGDLTAKLNAADLARAAVLAMGGAGAGGKPDFAQGGAPDDTKVAEGLAAIRAALS
jgi:alanyl-tRNA synthetase